MTASSLALRFPPVITNPRPKLPCAHLSHPQSLFPSSPLHLPHKPQPPPLTCALLLGQSGILPVVRAAAKDGGKGEWTSPAPSEVESEEEEARGHSTLPERFRYLTKEAPDRPVRWPWLIAVVVLIYAWRTVLWELSNWKKAVFGVAKFIGYIAKLLLAFIFHFIGDPITALIQCIELSLNFIRSIYCGIVAFTPVPELSMIILLTSAVLAIAEATVPNSVNEQPYLLTAAGLVGFGAVSGVILDVFFWPLLIFFFCYSRFVKKRDNVSASLPSVAVLVAIGEPWVRVLAMSAYLALAIFQHSKSVGNDDKDEALVRDRRLPVPLFLAALSIGIHLGAKWLRYRHLTWMIV